MRACPHPPPPTTISLFYQKNQVEALSLLHFIYRLAGPFIRTEKLSANVTISPPGQMVTTCLPKLPPLRACPLLHFFLMKLDKSCYPPSAGQHCSPNTAVNTLVLAIQHYSTVYYLCHLLDFPSVKSSL